MTTETCLLSNYFQTVEISRQYLALHSSYAQLIQAAADLAVRDGTPINTPIWWIAPDDRIALACNDGESISIGF